MKKLKQKGALNLTNSTMFRVQVKKSSPFKFVLKEVLTYVLPEAT